MLLWDCERVGGLMNRRKRLLLQVSFILIGGFFTTSLVSYVMARSSLRDQIVLRSLPLTSDNVYSEIQRDLLKPIFLSSLMAEVLPMRSAARSQSRRPL